MPPGDQPTRGLRRAGRWPLALRRAGAALECARYVVPHGAATPCWRPSKTHRARQRAAGVAGDRSRRRAGRRVRRARAQPEARTARARSGDPGAHPSADRGRREYRAYPGLPTPLRAPRRRWRGRGPRRRHRGDGLLARRERHPHDPHERRRAGRPPCRRRPVRARGHPLSALPDGREPHQSARRAHPLQTSDAAGRRD